MGGGGGVCMRGWAGNVVGGSVGGGKCGIGNKGRAGTSKGGDGGGEAAEDEAWLVVCMWDGRSAVVEGCEVLG